jgi:hypothetical protein
LKKYINSGCVTSGVALPFTLKSILRQKKKKNYGNSNISPCKNIPNLQKRSSKRNQNPSRYYNSGTNLKFQHKPKHIIFQKSIKLLYSRMNPNTISLPTKARPIK